MKLHVAPGLSLPAEAVTETFAVLGRRGSGKTYTAGVLVEELLETKHQVVVIDPLDVWWGLRASADGKGDGYPVTIFGGQKQDVPLQDTAGALLADVVVEHGVSAIFSLRHLSKAGARRFVGAFADRLYERKGDTKHRSPLHLVVDEADAFVPQHLSNDATACYGALDTIVRRGRSSGFGTTLISQRSAVISKDVLTQTEVLVAHQTTGPQDRKALEAWIEAHDTEGRKAAFLDSLASLPRGTAWWWSPGWLDVFKKVATREKRTFDSSSTPRGGERPAEPKRMTAIDLKALSARIAATVEESKANDPRELRAEVARLKRELAVKPAAAPKVERVEVPVLADSQVKRLEAVCSRMVAEAERHGKAMALFWGNQEELMGSVVGAVRSVAGRTAPVLPLRAPVNGAAPRVAPARPQPAPRARPRATDGAYEAPAGDLPPVQQRILDAIAEVEALGGTDRVDRALTALLAGYTNTTSKGFANAVSALSSAGHVAYPGDGLLALTDSGRALARPSQVPATRQDVQERVCSLIGGAAERILRPLIKAYPNSLSREDLAASAGYGNVTSKGFANTVSRLSSLGFLTRPGSGQLAAAPVLFLEGR